MVTTNPADSTAVPRQVHPMVRPSGAGWVVASAAVLHSDQARQSREADPRTEASDTCWRRTFQDRDPDLAGPQKRSAPAVGHPLGRPQSGVVATEIHQVRPAAEGCLASHGG